jgi:hypothetical protein
MKKKLRLTMIARKITGFKEPFELTTNFNYFVKKCLGYCPSYSSLGLGLFTLGIGIVYFWIPSCNIEHKIIYIPSICLISENRFVGFLIHEINHLKFPKMRELSIETISKQEVREWRESMRM